MPLKRKYVICIKKEIDVKNKLGFTLIELLVVIAIIAILAAILFPVFAKVRDKARQIADLSNTKQIGLALLQYTEDYDEHVVLNNNNDGNPDRYGTSGYGHWQDWQVLLMPYIKSTGENGVFHSPGGSAASGDYWNASTDLVDIPTPPGSFVSSFTLNNVYWDDSTLGGVFQNPSSSISKISDPADMIFCADGGAGVNIGNYGPANNYGGGGPENLYINPEQIANEWKFWGSTMPAGGLQYYDAKHAPYPQLDSSTEGDIIGHFNGGANCAFFDGHSKFMQISTLAKVYPCPSGFTDTGFGSQDMCSTGGVLPYFTTQADTFLH